MGSSIYYDPQRDFLGTDGKVYSGYYVSDAPRSRGWVRCEWVWFEPARKFVYAGRRPRMKDRTALAVSGLEEVLRMDSGQVLGFDEAGAPVVLGPVPEVSGRAGSA